MSIRPEIPDVQGVKDEATTKILRDIKSAFDSVTGRSQPKIKTLGSNANFFGTVKKVNEIINRIQGDPNLDLGAVTTIPEQGGAIAGSGTVTAITAGTGLDGGTITASGTISISTQITAGGPVGSAATVPVVTFNAQGQVTAVSTATITPAAIGAPSGSGTSTGSNTGDQTIVLTGDVTGTGSGSFAATLATVTTNTGSFGGTSAVPVVTVNAKGLVTAVGTATITPLPGIGSALQVLQTNAAASAAEWTNWPVDDQTIDAAETMTIPAGFSKVMAGPLVNNCTLSISGRLQIT